MHLKSEKLKKLEAELKDLERWMELGLVPKKDLPKHKEEILAISHKVEEEVERLKFLKEHGDLEEYVAPKRQPGKAVYQAEMPTIPDVEFGDTQVTEGFEGGETETAQATETTVAEGAEDGEETVQDEDEESYFSERARWRRGGRGGIIDPEADDW